MTEFKGTPHNSAKIGEIARTVIMPGDPFRAQFIAETYLQDAREFNHVRGMLGYTGTYKGKEISIMGHGMGIPSIAIYSYELFKFYGVENIIRTGSCGAKIDELNLYDIILVDATYSDSSFAKVAFGYEEDIMYPDKELTDRLEETARIQNKKVFRGMVHCGDDFYSDPEKRKNAPYPVLAGEMESFGLFTNARYLNKKAACLLTVSDKPGEVTTHEERRIAFRGMMEIALDTAIEL